MKNYFLVPLATLAVSLLTAAPAFAAPTVTLRSLLEEMTDREATAQWPAPAYTLKTYDDPTPKRLASSRGTNAMVRSAPFSWWKWSRCW